MTLWLEVTQDELELPLVVADSAKELADLRNVKTKAIWIHHSRWLRGKIKRGKYRKVVIDDGAQQ